DVAKSIERLRDHARAFFSELALAHRGSERARGTLVKSEERVRATQSSLSRTLDAAACVTGALDVIESALAQMAPKGAGPSSGSEDTGLAEQIESLVRRARELRDELRLLLRGDDPDFVYFVEFRGRGIFLRAAPVDVSKIVRELLLDRMHTTVLTSATLT